MLIVKNIENKTVHSVQELHSCLFSSSPEAILASFTSSTFSVHSSVSLSTTFFLHVQFSQSKYSPALHDLSHSHSQLLGFEINILSHTPLSIIFLHSHLHLSSFQRYYYKRLHRIFICIYKFHAILYVLVHQFMTLD